MNIKTVFSISSLHNDASLISLLNSVEGIEYDNIVTALDAISAAGFNVVDLVNTSDAPNLCLTVQYVDSEDDRVLGNAPNYYFSVRRP